MAEPRDSGYPISRDGVAGVVWIAFGAFLLWQSFQLLTLEEATASGIFGPAFYPRLLAGLIAALGLFLVLKDSMGRRRATTAGNRDQDSGPGSGRGDLRHSAAALLWLLGYTYVLEPLGYLLATPVMLAGLMWLMGERRWTRVLIWSAGLTIALFVVFRHAVKVILPEGLLA